MNKKEIFGILLLICVIFSLQAVVAADSGSNSTDSNVLSVDNNVSSYALPSANSNSLEAAGDKTFDDLQTLVDGDVSGFANNNYTWASGNSEVKITKSITLDGQGKVIIDAKKQSRIFNIEGKDTIVILKGITFINGNANGHGGSINSDGVLTIENCNFINNTADGHGGAIYLGTTSGDTITNCNFEGNIAGLNGGAIDWRAGSTNGKVIDSTFTNNTAKRSGGAIHWSGHNGTISNTNFTGNKATGEVISDIGGVLGGGDGGAVLWVGSHGIIKDNCNFINNFAQYRGGAIFLHGNSTENCTNTTVTNCNFEDNIAGLNGGAIDWQRGANNGTLSYSNFTNNTAWRSGGAVYWYGNDGDITWCRFEDNHAIGNVSEHNKGVASYTTNGGNGGAIIWTGALGRVNYSNFVDNTAKNNGGAVYLTGSSDGLCENTTFDNCYFGSNEAGLNGGAIDWYRGAFNGTITNSIFENNIANRSGGAIHWSGYYGTVSNSNFTGNKATGEVISDIGGVLGGGDGGAVIWVGSHGIIKDNCNFINNFAKYRGGAVFLHGNSTENCTNTTVTNCNFEDNVAGLNGGAIDWQHGTTYGNLTYSNFTNNTAWRSGGAVYWNGLYGDILYCRFDDNHAIGNVTAHDRPDVAVYSNEGGHGGAVIWTGSHGEVYYSSFVNNTAKNNGGAVYLQSGTYGECQNTTFDNCYFGENEAGLNGGAVDWFRGASLGKVLNSVFENNIANRSGGAIHWSGHYGTISNSNFTGNKATGEVISDIGGVLGGGDGGAVIWVGSHGIINDNSNFINNYAKNRGGAIFLHGNSTEYCVNTTVVNSNFEDNVAGTNGGAIDWYEGAHDGTVENVTFKNNTAHRNGGAIFWHGTNGEVKNSIFINNRATGTNWEYTYAITMSDVIIINVTNPGEININDLVNPGESSKLYVINQTLSSSVSHFESYVFNGTAFIKLDETDINVTESIISPVDWGIDQYFGGDGGTILWSGDIGLVYNCSFVDSNSARRGGGAYMTGSDYVTYNLCNFTDCTSGTNGGGVDWLAGANYGKIYNCIFNNTRAARSAGAIYYDGDYGDMKNITIINTTSNGGSLPASKDGLVHYAGWDSSHWDTNTTGGDAGAIMITGDHLHMYNVTFTNCTSVGRGGAVFLQDNTNVTFELCTFINNYAKGIANNTWKNYTQERNDANNDTKVDYKLTGHGGAIAFDVDATNCKIIDSKFYNNLGRRNGGAINFDQGSTNNTIRNSIFENNTVYDDGGAINFDHGSDYCSVFDSTFYNNTGLGRFGSTSKGGTICLTGSNITISDSKFTLGGLFANTSEGAKLNETDGGAIFVTGNDVNITNNVFDRCYSPNNAGAINVIGNNTLINQCNFKNCNSTLDGGAIYVRGLACKIFDSNFTNIVSGENGGAIYIDGDDVFVKGSAFNNTFVGRDSHALFDGDLNMTKFDEGFVGKGGAIYIKSDNARILDTVINSSSAIRDGGAIYVEGNNATISVDFVNCSVGFPAAWITPDIALFNPVIDEVLSRINIVFTFADSLTDINPNLTSIYNSLSNIRNNLVNNIFVNQVLNVTNLHAAIGNLTELNNTLPAMIKADIPILEILNLTSIVETLKSIPDNATYKNYNSKVTSSAQNILNRMNAINDAKAILETFLNNLGSSSPLNSYLNSLKKATSLKQFNEIFENIPSYLKNINDCLSGINKYYVGGYDFIELRNNISYINSQLNNIKKISNGLENLGVKGGAIYVEGNNTNITKANFENCFVSDVLEGDGGAIYVNGINTTIEKSEFTDCYVSDNGGSIFVDGDNTSIDNSTFTNSHSILDGGAVYVQGLYCTLSNSTFTNNYAGDDGGAIYWEGNHGNVFNITCNNNKGISLGTSSSNGGTIAIIGSNITVDESSFEKSYAQISGGAIFITGDNVHIIRSYFDRCNVSLTDTVVGKDYTTGGGAIYILGENANVDNCTFLRSHGKEGGVIYVHGKNATINHIISNLTYALNGGSIYILGIDATIMNSNFSFSNSTAAGGAIYIQGNKANVKNSTFNLTNARFSPTTSRNTNLGGAIYIQGNNANISYSKFANSFAYRGGMIYLEGSYCDVINSSFENGHTSWDGGAVYATGSYSNVLNSNFTNNVADEDGGALFWYGKSSGNVVDGCIFIGNIAYAPGDTITPDTGKRTTRGGGAIYWSEGGINAIVRNSQFINNSARTNAKADGGAILWDYSSGTAILDNCIFDGNFISTTANIAGKSPWVQGGAIYIRPTGNFIINNSEFRNCWSFREAGALYIDGANAPNTQILNTKFINNTAKGQGADVEDNDRGGDGLMIKGTKNVWVINATFINNTANYGGGLSIWKLQSSSIPIVHVINTTFDGNKATGGKEGSNSGGSIYSTLAANFELKNITISNSKADYKGGGIFFLSNPVVTYDNLTFINNSAEQGGAIYWDKAVTIQGINFINNSAVQGGAIFVPNAQTIQNNNFTGNRATAQGGAIYVNSSGVTVQNNNFTNNTASMGGAIFAPISDNTMIIKYCDFDGNNATTGGAIYIGYKGADGKTITDCTFTRNTAVLDGGAIYLANIDHQLARCTFESNSAHNGGSVYVSQELTNVKISDSIFISSHAYDGGAVYYGGSDNGLTIYNDTFRKNTAVYNGGAIYYIAKENGIICVYRDFNNFDGIGNINSTTKRTDVYTNDTHTHIIQRSLFEENYDYLLKIFVDSSLETPVITVFVDSPTNVSGRNIKAVIKLTNTTTGDLISQVIIDPTNYDSHMHDGKLVATFTGLLSEEYYNVTVEFSNYDYLFKGNSTQAQAHGNPIGDFTLLQNWINGNVSRGIYDIYLPRTMIFTPFENNDTSRPLDTKCMNISRPGEQWGHAAAGGLCVGLWSPSAPALPPSLQPGSLPPWMLRFR